MPRKKKDWLRKINNLLSPYRYAYKGTLIKFGATRYPYPAVSIQVWHQGKKLIEWAISDIHSLIEDLDIAADLLKDVRMSEGRESRRQTQHEYEYDGEASRRSRRRRKPPERD